MFNSLRPSEIPSAVATYMTSTPSSRAKLLGLAVVLKRTCDYFERHTRRLKKQRASESLASLFWLEKEGLKPMKLEVLNLKTNKRETIQLKSLEEALYLDGEQLDEENPDIVSMMLYVKDRFNVSGSAYHDMANVCRQMPGHYTLQRRINELNKLWDINPTPNGVIGVQQSLHDRLILRVKHLLKTSTPDAPFLEEQEDSGETIR